MGCPVPNDLDGRVLTEALTTHLVRGHPIEWAECDKKTGDSKAGYTGYSTDEEKEIEARLRDLGYVQ